jgi:hypothetical protein
MANNTSTAVSAGSLIPSAGLSQVQKTYSCVLCAQRKVRCDKRPGGCNNCTKAHVTCIYKAPPPPRRKRKGVRDTDTTTKLRIYEDALRKAGIDPLALVNDQVRNDRSPVEHIDRDRHTSHDEESRARSGPGEMGVLVSENGKSRYLDNGIWTSLRSEFRDLKEILDETSDEESADSQGRQIHDLPPDGSQLLFGSPTSLIGLRTLHPKPIVVFKLWQTYLDNINPLIKVFHAPTVQQTITEAVSNIDKVPCNAEALLFAIYCVSIESLSDEECVAITGESKDTARQRYRSGAQHALINASFLKTSDLMVLQALTLFIVSCLYTIICVPT